MFYQIVLSVCSTRFFYQSVLSAYSIGLFYRSVLSVCSVSLFYQSVLLVSSISLFYQSVLSACSINLFYKPVLSICSISLFYQPTPSVWSVLSVCSISLFYVCSISLFYVCSISLFYVCSISLFYLQVCVSVLFAEDEFLQALGFEDRSQALTRDRKFVQVSFSLNKGSLKLLPSPKFPDPFQCEPILELKFSSLRSTVDVSPKVKETTFSLSLGSIHVVDHQNIDSLFPFILQSRIGSGDTGSTSSPLIKVDVKRETVKHRPVWR